MNPTHRLIAHGLLKINGQYLVIKRSEIKRGSANVYPQYWDIPGGSVETGELPQVAVIRETKEEVNLDVIVEKILYEDSNFDQEKNLVFTRLVYETKLVNSFNVDQIKLDREEHSEFKLIKSLDELKVLGQKVVPYLEKIIR